MKKNEYGIKIKNIKAGSLYEYNLGLRDRYEQKDAVFTNSLLLYFLLDKGLNVKNGFTKDIVCIDFDYGARGHKEEVNHLEKLIKKAITDEEKNKLEEILTKVNLNENKYKKTNKESIRTEFYKNGVSIIYNTKTESIKIKYKMLYRSTGKAKSGSCMFINESLYDIAHDFIYMGIKLPYANAPIVEASGYVPLIASSIVDTIKINPKDILILKDVDRYFETNVVSIETNELKQCIAKHIENYKLKNTLFDGQALIDSSIFPKWGNGYILLRNHFTKMASFKTNIQLFFKDYFKENYETAIVEDMFGEKHLAKDIKLITTDNSLKWIKFGVSYDYWCKKVNENNNLFGIVKTAHESKMGNVQRMSYQMINSLNLDTMDETSKTTIEYIESIKKDNKIFLDYLDKNKNFSNDYEVLVELCKQNYDFTRSEYFRNRKKKILNTYLTKVKTGKLLQTADNLTIVGSPYAMLLYSVGDNIEKDNTFTQETGAIQCFTKRFKDEEYLAGFRSPHNSLNNIVYFHNVYNEIFFKYFDFCKNIVAVNLNGTDLQDRLNGSDQDSDSIYMTNLTSIVSHAKYCYKNYPTIVNNIPKEKNNYTNSLINYAKIDNKLSASKLAIGESSNLAQLALTYSYNFEDQKYKDYVCILSVIAQIAIDSAKRTFDIDIDSEIKRIKGDMDIKTNGYPLFWKYIKPDFKENKINPKLKCPMNYICNINVSEFKPEDSTLPMGYFFKQFELDMDRKLSQKVEKLIEKYSLNIYISDNEKEDYLLNNMEFENLIEDIQKMKLSKKYLGLFSWLINRAFMITSGSKRNKDTISNNTDKNKSILLKTLYDVNKECLLKCFSNNC